MTKVAIGLRAQKGGAVRQLAEKPVAAALLNRAGWQSYK